MGAYIDRVSGDTYYFEGTGGDHIDNTLAEAIGILSSKQRVSDLRKINKGDPKETFKQKKGFLKFNDVQIPLEPEMDVLQAKAWWERETERKRAEWKASPEGIAYEQKQFEERVARQKEMDELFPQLEAHLKAHIAEFPGQQPNGETAAELFRLLNIYIPLSDWNDQNSYRAEVVELLLQAGYIAGEYVGPPEAIVTPDHARAYVVGQILSSYEKYQIFWPSITMFIERGKLDTVMCDLVEMKRNRRPPKGKSPFEAK